MDEFKRVPFKYMGRKTMVTVRVSSYLLADRLYVGVSHRIAKGLEGLLNLTINLPQYPLKYNEAFIEDQYSDDLLAFIKENKLGTILPYTVKSKHGVHHVVAFDMDKLREFDPEDVQAHEERYKAHVGRS